MPEGDTIRRLAERIERSFAGQRVLRSALRDPRLAGRAFDHATLLGADAYGKHLFVRFDTGSSLHAHLAMEGEFRVGPPSPVPEWQRRLELWFGAGRLTAENVAVLELIDTGDEQLVTAALGPDLCAPSGAPDPVSVAARLARRPDVALSAAMLDQGNVAGWGNVYVNEVPFVVGVDPFQPVGTIDALVALVAIGTALIRANTVLGRHNTTGRRLGTDARWVHGAGRRPCPVCGARLEHRDGARSPWQRSITWCPACQPAAVAAVVDVERAARLLALHPASRQPSFPS